MMTLKKEESRHQTSNLSEIARNTGRNHVCSTYTANTSIYTNANSASVAGSARGVTQINAALQWLSQLALQVQI